jgi:hypothetical protein
MAKLRVGNKQNSKLNGEWAGHVRGKMKKVTSSKRRMADKDILKKEKKESEYEKLQKKVFDYNTKYKEGFIKSEIEHFLEELNINERRFYKALGVNTCMLIDGEVITYHTDILKGVVCAIENREQNSLEWD